MFSTGARSRSGWTPRSCGSSSTRSGVMALTGGRSRGSFRLPGVAAATKTGTEIDTAEYLPPGTSAGDLGSRYRRDHGTTRVEEPEEVKAALSALEKIKPAAGNWKRSLRNSRARMRATMNWRSNWRGSKRKEKNWPLMNRLLPVVPNSRWNNYHAN